MERYTIKWEIPALGLDQERKGSFSGYWGLQGWWKRKGQEPEPWSTSEWATITIVDLLWAPHLVPKSISPQRPCLDLIMILTAKVRTLGNNKQTARWQLCCCQTVVNTPQKKQNFYFYLSLVLLHVLSPPAGCLCVLLIIIHLILLIVITPVCWMFIFP